MTQDERGPLAEWSIEIKHAPPQFRRELKRAIANAHGGAVYLAGLAFFSTPDIPRTGVLRFTGTDKLKVI